MSDGTQVTSEYRENKIELTGDHEGCLVLENSAAGYPRVRVPDVGACFDKIVSPHLHIQPRVVTTYLGKDGNNYLAQQTVFISKHSKDTELFSLRFYYDDYLSANTKYQYIDHSLFSFIVNNKPIDLERR